MPRTAESQPDIVDIASETVLLESSTLFLSPRCGLLTWNYECISHFVMESCSRYPQTCFANTS